MSNPKRHDLPRVAINAALNALPENARNVVDASDVKRMVLAALLHIDLSSTGDLVSQSVAGRTLFRPYKSEKR